MEVILREHVDNLGRRGEIVKVADGYARNYLLPRRLALTATVGNRKLVEREREKLELRESEEKEVAEAIAGRLSSLELVMLRKVGETDALYGSVTSGDLVKALADHGIEIERRKVQLPEPIRQLGEFNVPIKLHREVITHVKLRVNAEGAAAASGETAQRSGRDESRKEQARRKT
jgi:large subunit ribosomal protein L9